MIYFTKDALRIVKNKFFHLELNDGSKAIVYKQDVTKAKEAIKKEKYRLKFSFYSMLDRNDINTKDDVYLLGVGNKQRLLDKILKILNMESLNVIYLKISSKWNILFLSDKDAVKDVYKSLSSGQYSWPCIVADEEFSKKLKQKMKPERELSNIINELKKID